MKSAKDYYDDYGMKEWKRLVGTPYMKLEFDTTMLFLKRCLPKKGLILDAGSGPGRYSITLAKMGYNVTLLDISLKQLEIGRKQIEKSCVKDNIKDIIEGSIVDLSMFEDNSFDAVICLGGALSHLINKNDRKKAASELIRVAKKGCPVIVSVIGRLGVIKHELTKNPKEIESHAKIFKKILVDGDYKGKYDFTPSHFFKAKELRKLFEVKATISEIVGLEGLATHHNTELIDLYEKRPKAWKTWWEIHLRTCTEPCVVETSEHLMVICRKR